MRKLYKKKFVLLNSIFCNKLKHKLHNQNEFDNNSYMKLIKISKTKKNREKKLTTQKIR